MRFDFTTIQCKTTCVDKVTVFLWDATKDVKIKKLPDGGRWSQCLADSYSLQSMATSVTMTLTDPKGFVKTTTDPKPRFYLGKNKGSDVLPVQLLSKAGKYKFEVELTNGGLKTFYFKILGLRLLKHQGGWRDKVNLLGVDHGLVQKLV